MDGARMELFELPRQPLSRADATRQGISRAQFEKAVQQGLLVRRTRGIYTRADVADSFDLRVAVVAAIVSPHHVACDRTAAWIHGVNVHVFAEQDVLPAVEVCALRGRNPTHLGEARGRSRDLSAKDVITIDGLNVTTPLRTALDLGCNLRRREAFAGMVGLARAHGFGAEEVVDQLPRFKGRRGVRQCRALAGLIEPRLESPREAWTWLEIVNAGLPLPVPQYWIEVDGQEVYRLDFAYPRLRVAVEYDGHDFHSSPEQVTHDQERRTYLREEGWTVIVIQRGDFTAQAVSSWLGDLRRALVPPYSNRRW